MNRTERTRDTSEHPKTKDVWKNVKLGDLLDFFNGKAIKPGGAGQYPVYGSNGLIGYCDDSLYDDGLIIGRVGAYCGSIDYCNGKFWASDNTIVAKPKDDSDILFVYYLLKELRLNRHAGGAAQPLVTQSILKQVATRVPTLRVQQKIASIISAYDELIENNTRRIKILEEMAQKIYRVWFVEFRAPGVELRKATPEEKELTGRDVFPKGWIFKPVVDAVLVNPKTTVPKEGRKPFVPMASLTDNSMLIRDIQLKEGNGGSKFKNGDTLFARITPCLENGKTGFVQFLESDDNVAFGSTEFIVLRSKTLTPEYVYLMARSNEFRDNAIKSMSGATGRQRVQEECFHKFFIAQPDGTTLTKFSEVVRRMFQLTHSLSLKNQNLRRTRDLLLPKLISGEIQVD
jgi:type I restriction enzyme S subunit